MRNWKKAAAGFLAAVMVVAALPFSAETVYAEETVNLEVEAAAAELSGAYQFGGKPSGEESFDASESYIDGVSENVSVEEYLYEQMRLKKSSIDVFDYNIPKENAGSLVSGVLNEHPDLYFVNRAFSYNFINSTGMLNEIFLTYGTDYDDEAFQNATNTALSLIKPEMSDLEKAIVLHDYLAVNCEYDKENLDANTLPDTVYSAYGVLVNRSAVCNGYALAYKYLLNKAGILCYMVTSDSMNHAWNMVVLDGQYYQADVTWDDPTWDLIGRVGHNYMFRSDSAFEGHSDWRVTSGSEVVDYKATDTRYDAAFWKSSNAPLVLEGMTVIMYRSGIGKLRRAV